MQSFTLVQEAGNIVVVIDKITGSRERVQLSKAAAITGSMVEIEVPPSLPSQKVCTIAT